MKNNANVDGKTEPAGTFVAPAPKDRPAIFDAEAQVPAEWSVGDAILDTYEVKQIHSGGGMGLVYRVYHRDWQEELAVKSPRPEYFATQEQRENFVRECVTWIGLGLHPHIVTCYYVRLLGGIPRVFAEYVAGGTLQDWIKDRKLYRGGPEQALERMLDVAIQIARGLHFAHEKKVIHRDVKPANVMITLEGVAKVADFGLARARAASGETVVAGHQQSILLTFGGGYTPEFCSPEQAGKQPLTRRTDVWSWGVSVLEMFTGEVFWPSGTTAAASLDSYVENGAEDDVIPRMPDGLVALLRECFRNPEEDRPKDMSVIVERLKTIYRSTLGCRYRRAEGKETEATADVFNNEGLSYYNLGMAEEGLKCFEEAVASNPLHLEATYNRGLQLWRSKKLTSDEVISQLMNVAQSRPDNPIVDYMKGLIHLERGDVESAARTASGEKLHLFEVGRALMGARNGMGKEWERLRRFEGHTMWVNSVAISPDGRWGLHVSDNALWLLELANGQCLRTFEGHTDLIESVAIGPDGQWALSGSRDKTIRLWDLASGQCLRVFEGHTDFVTSVAISPDGQWALSGSRDETIRLWDLATGQCLRTFEGHTYNVKSVAVSPDGRWGLSSRNGDLWDLASGQRLRTFDTNSYANSVAISPDGRWGLSGGDDKTLRLWELGSGRCLRTFEGHTGQVNSVAISPDGRWGLSGSGDHFSRDNTLRLWDLASGQCLRIFEGHTDQVISVAISSDGQWALSGSRDETIRLWDLAWSYRSAMTPSKPQRVYELLKQSDLFGTAIKTAEAHLEKNEFDAAIHFVKEARAVQGYERHAKCISVLDRLACHCKRSGIHDAWQMRTFSGPTSSITSVAISPDGRWVLSGSIDNTLRLWDLAKGQCLRTFDGHRDFVESVAITPDGQWGLSGSRDKTLRLWDFASGQCLRTFEGRTEAVNSVAISPDGRWGLSGSEGEITPRLWDLVSGDRLHTFEGHRDDVNSVAITPDGRWVLSGSHDKTIRLWDLVSGDRLHTFEGHTSFVNSVAISPNGRWVLSGDYGKTIRLWDLASGQCLRTFEGHTEAVNSVAISPDGRWGLSGSRDKTLRLWDLASGQCLRTFEGHTEAVNSVAISPDGRWALSGSGDNTLRLWKLDWNYEFPGWADWDEGARPYLSIFLTLHCPTGPDGFPRVGKPAWNEGHFQGLIKDLQHRGYGWLRPEGVRRELKKMKAEWKGPPRLLQDNTN